MGQKGCAGAVLALGLTIGVLAGPAAAQSDLAPNQGFGDRPRVGIGYVANAPNMFQGVSAYLLLDTFGGLGFYIDAKRNSQSPRTEQDFLDTMSVAEAEALPDSEAEFDDFGHWSVNGALVRPLTPELMLYLGAGYTFEDVYYRYRTSDTTVGTFGYFWVHDEEASTGRLNVLGGAFFRMSRYLALQFGYEFAPRGFTVGGSYSFSIR